MASKKETVRQITLRLDERQNDALKEAARVGYRSENEQLRYWIDQAIAQEAKTRSPLPQSQGHLSHAQGREMSSIARSPHQVASRSADSEIDTPDLQCTQATPDDAQGFAK